MDAWNGINRGARAKVRFGDETGANNYWGANRYWWVLLSVAVLAMSGGGGESKVGLGGKKVLLVLNEWGY